MDENGTESIILFRHPWGKRLPCWASPRRAEAVWAEGWSAHWCSTLPDNSQGKMDVIGKKKTKTHRIKITHSLLLPHLISEVINTVERWVNHQHGVGQRLVLQLAHGEHPVIQPGAGPRPEGLLEHEQRGNMIQNCVPTKDVGEKIFSVIVHDQV